MNQSGLQYIRRLAERCVTEPCQGGGIFRPCSHSSCHFFKRNCRTLAKDREKDGGGRKERQAVTEKRGQEIMSFY